MKYRGMTIAWIGMAIPNSMTRNETAEKREPCRTIRYPAARESTTTTTAVPAASSTLLRKYVPIPELSNMAAYEDRVSPPVGSQALAVRYSEGDRKLMSTM